MWNKLLQLLQEPIYKRLLLALLISALLHAWLVGSFNFSLPTLKKEMHTIEARIQMPKAVPKPTESTPEPPIEPAPAEQAVKPEPVNEAPPEANIDALSEPVPEPVVEAPTPEPTAELVPMSSETAPSQPPQVIREPEQPIDTGLVINENAYQYIETEFDVRTKIDGSAEGKAIITYNLVDSTQYSIRWLTEGSGMAALFFPDLLQTSAGTLTKTGLQPYQYSYLFGKKADKSRTATFDWQTKKVTLQTSKGTKIEDLPDNTQDLLSFMYQFMHVAPLQHMQLPIVNGKKLRVYDYSFEGEEQVNSPLGELKTLHILHSGSSEEEKTELWLAIDYQYVPVKIRKIENDGKVVEMLATRITTNRPVINQ